VSTIERAGSAGRARKQAAQALLSAVTAEQFLALDALFDEAVADGVSKLTWLKSIPVAATAGHW
jgi:hypothetical protein